MLASSTSNQQNREVQNFNQNLNHISENQRFEIIVATKENGNFDQIIKLVNKAYWKFQRDFFTNTQESRIRLDGERLTKILEEDDKKFFLLIDKVNQEIAGTILLELPEDKSHAKFGLFAIGKHYRGKDLGSLMITHVENYAKSQNRNLMKIEVLTFATGLARHYQKLGYQPTGKTTSFPHENCVRQEYVDPEKRYLQRMKKQLV